MTHWKVQKAPPIQTEIVVPGDKSISHRAVIIASLANGVCVITGFLASDDCMRTVEAMRALGIQIEQPEPTTLVVHGRKGKLTAPQGEIDCGNSGTTMRLLAGLLSAQPFKSRLIGDASLSARPMKRVIEPLSEMGARITAEGAKQTPPLVIEGAKPQPIHYFMPVASAQVKSAILLAGLFARGKTTVIEPSQSRDHTERMLSYFLVRPHKDDLAVSVFGVQTPESRDFMVPGDMSSAAFWLVAAASQPRSHLLVKDVGLNETRTGVLAVLGRMGAHVREIIEKTDEGEPSGSVQIDGVRLKGTTIQGREIPNVIDEIPILAVAGALASGVTVIADAKELRVKETDRLAAIATNLRVMGVEVTEREDGLEIIGGSPLRGARLKSFGDHRIAMAFAIAGLFADGETIIDDVECVETSYPGFHDTLELIMKPKRETQTRVIGGLPSHDGTDEK
ncbi:MAG: 3-phosphoshikimate 1-carboxyvinyltransferase [Chthoniobacter sp.]|jgi:3-phosphoshikimate 1-carboxyvinyltransferase|nr:3-phosphoshikimate 1-carboxyvinyltransferase [Chthoniobacter sp.]